MNFLVLGIFLISMITSEPQKGGEIQLIIKETKSDKGVIQILVFNQNEGFPGNPKKALKALSAPITNSLANVTIGDLPSGNYAISVFHDEDSDGNFQKNSFGIPLDKYGFSNNPTLYFGPPSFSKCAVAIKDAPLKVEISLR
jgi:uncharacterized protein (DUF2141 family)